jgi:hypothetical protein
VYWGVLVAIWLVPVGAAAQEAEETAAVEQREAHELSVLRGESSDVAIHYTVGVSLLGTASLLIGLPIIFTGLRSGDTTDVAAFLVIAPVGALLGGSGLSLLAAALGWDIALGVWRGSLGRSDGAMDAAVSTLATASTIFYVTAGAFLLTCAASLLAAPFVRDGAPLVVAGISGSAGYLSLLVGIGLDIGRGAWSGAHAAVLPLDGGAMASVGSTF